MQFYTNFIFIVTPFINSYLCFPILQEIIFVINESLEGGYEAEAIGLSIFTEADSWDDLKNNIIESVLCYFDDDVRRILS